MVQCFCKTILFFVNCHCKARQENFLKGHGSFKPELRHIELNIFAKFERSMTTHDKYEMPVKSAITVGKNPLLMRVASLGWRR